MQRIILVLVILISCKMTFSQKKKNTGFVKIENLVEFTVDSVISNSPVDIMVFTLKVTNKTDKPIPDLGVSNLSKNVNFLY
jgi:hypothetical protein